MASLEPVFNHSGTAHLQRQLASQVKQFLQLPQEQIQQFAAALLLDRESLRGRTKPLIGHISNFVGFISFLEVTLGESEKRTQCFRELSDQTLTPDQLRILPGSFCEIYIGLHWNQFSWEEKENFLPILAVKLPDSKITAFISSRKLEPNLLRPLLVNWARGSPPLQMFLQQLRAFKTDDGYIEVLKAYPLLTPENLTAVLKRLGREVPIELIRHLLARDPEAMAYKMESFPLSNATKLQLFRELVANHPWMVAKWKAVLKTETREVLAKNSPFVQVLQLFDWEKEDVIRARVSGLLGLEGEGLPFLEFKALAIWWAFVLEGNRPELLPVAREIASLPERVRYSWMHLLLTAPTPVLAVWEKCRSWCEGFSSEQQIVILSSLLRILLSPSLHLPAKEKIFQQLERSEDRDAFYDKLQATHSLLAVDAAGLDTSEDVRDLFVNKLRQLLPALKGDSQTLMRRFSQTFGAFRIPEALIVYATCLQNLASKERPPVLGALAQLVEDAFAGDFEQRRYDPSSSVHLKTLFERYPELYQSWMENHVESSLSGALQGCRFVEADDLQSLSLSTTEVPGSCLSIRGDAGDNKSMLALPLDGKSKLLLILNSRGEMLVRAIVRFLLDEVGRPILLLDTLFSTFPYSDDPQSLYQQAVTTIAEGAKMKAQIMGIPLLKTYTDSDSLPSYPVKVLSLGGRAPFECCNAVGAQGDDETCRDSRFKIQRTKVLFSPKETTGF